MGKLFPFSATLLALLCFATGSLAQEPQGERPRLDPSWTDAPESGEDEGAEPKAPATATPPVKSEPPLLPPPLPPPSMLPPIPWTTPERWFRVELSGDQPRLKFTIFAVAKGTDKKLPIHSCANPCRVLLPRGEYRVKVSGNPEQVEGDRWIEVTADTAVRFSLPDRSARTTGLALGITGSALLPVGVMVLYISSWNHCSLRCEGQEGNDKPPAGFYVGATMAIAGAVLTPLGWVKFGRNRRPRIEQRSLGGTPREAAAPRIGIGVAPIAGGAAAGFSASF